MLTVGRWSVSVWLCGLWLGVPIAIGGCQSPAVRESEPAAPTVPGVATSTPAAAPQMTPSPAAIASPSPAADPALYDQAIERGSLAYQLTQTARTPADWDLVVSRWQQAIALLQSVPTQSSDHARAQAKISEYQQYIKTATTKADDLRGQVAGRAPSLTAGQKRTFRVRIVSRAAGTPIVLVNINGQDLVPMVVDTGASSVVLTQAVAQGLGIPVTGTTYAAVANGAVVAFGVGQVRSLDIGGAKLENVTVAIAPPDLDIGLLGNTFLSRYDVDVQQDWIVFRER